MLNKLNFKNTLKLNALRLCLYPLIYSLSREIGEYGYVGDFNVHI